ncbi:STAS domain-containing protein [Nonomuraea sp. NEAU-A123]|uniref:STAS domain-containing protein n=1 Tax=Nonomuraea sp. NEAU-A123 TaxID=2839649 RepID=UPI0035AB79AE
MVRALASITGGGVCVDLADLEFIDVGCLRALVDVAARRDAGHVLTLRSAPPQVHRLLVLTGWGPAEPASSGGLLVIGADDCRSPRDRSQPPEPLGESAGAVDDGGQVARGVRVAPQE